MSIDQQGFLAPEIAAYQQRLRNNHVAYFAFFDEVHQFCHQTKYRVQVHNRDGQELFAICCFLKLLGDVEGAILLAERSLISPAGSLLRVATEALIILGKICESYDFVEAYIRIGEAHRLRMVRAMRENPAPAFDRIRPEITDELISHIETLVGEGGDGNVRRWASDVGLLGIYDAIYRLFSREVHTHPRALERYLETDEAGEFIRFNWGPNDGENLAPELLEAARILITALHYMDQLFVLELAGAVARFTAELAKLDEAAAPGDLHRSSTTA